MSSMGIGSKPCLDIRPSNNQINDRSITFSQLGKAPKLRHSFVGLHTDQTKSSRRPTSLISESSLSSGTSSSSLSKSSTTSSNSSAHHNHHTHHYQPGVGLELINESQALDQNDNCKSLNQQPQQQQQQQPHHYYNHSQMTNGSGCLSHMAGSVTNGGSIAARHRNNHKRSTTIVSQLSMESGIMSDMCMTPDQDNNDLITTWPSNPTDALISPTAHGTGNKFLLKCHTYAMGKNLHHQHQHTQQQCQQQLQHHCKDAKVNCSEQESLQQQQQS